VEPLAFLAAILGAGGLGAILKISLGASGKAQADAYGALEEQRAGFQKVLDSHLAANRDAMSSLVDAIHGMNGSLIDEHRETRQLLRDQEIRVREALGKRQKVTDDGPY
jgi:adenylosuccinate lyase